ncbi:unnamed protein product, partial [Vitis vinifera]|uniref:Uncharacterized protein n=1 Tax=Vitis vinifera TaxID=29760 RepID=D7UDX1_VITVI|eukprot:XP_010645376.1 PREDICTED: uncharacterized protein LOC104877863 [Vitis vinifera]
MWSSKTELVRSMRNGLMSMLTRGPDETNGLALRNGHGYHKIEKKGEVLKGTVEVLKIKKVRLSVGKQERSKFASFLRGVARWDDIEWPSTQVMESRSVEGATTGYVPDEWDEEYDRGEEEESK